MSSRKEQNGTELYFNRLGEIAGEYLRKGSKIYVEGSLRTRKWQDKSGQDRYTTEIITSEMQMLDSKGSNTGADSQTSSKPSFKPEQSTPTAQPEVATEFDDDIPF